MLENREFSKTVLFLGSILSTVQVIMRRGKNIAVYKALKKEESCGLRHTLF